MCQNQYQCLVSASPDFQFDAKTVAKVVAATNILHDIHILGVNVYMYRIGEHSVETKCAVS